MNVSFHSIYHGFGEVILSCDQCFIRQLLSCCQMTQSYKHGTSGSLEGLLLPVIVCLAQDLNSDTGKAERRNHLYLDLSKQQESLIVSPIAQLLYLPWLGYCISRAWLFYILIIESPRTYLLPPGAWLLCLQRPGYCISKDLDIVPPGPGYFIFRVLIIVSRRTWILYLQGPGYCISSGRVIVFPVTWLLYLLGFGYCISSDLVIVDPGICICNHR